jgi:glucosyl-dolichyl phosphate glucuronosyltransferase
LESFAGFTQTLGEENVPQVSVIICGYSDARWGDLLAAIGSMQRQTKPPHEIIVVIDHNPSLLNRLREATSGITLVENAGVQGVSGSRNTGIALASGDVIAFLDDDAIADPTCLEYLLDGFADETVAGVGGEVRPLWVAGRPRWFPEEFYWVIGCTYRGLERREVRNLLGANMAFRRDCILRSPGFKDGRIVATGNRGRATLGEEDDETYFCIRLTNACPGMKLIYTSKSGVQHRVPANRCTWRYFLRRCYSEGMSKRTLVRLLGTEQLGTEKIYVRKTLTTGVLRELARAIIRLDPMAVARAVAIFAGLSATVAGYELPRSHR